MKLLYVTNLTVMVGTEDRIKTGGSSIATQFIISRSLSWSLLQ